MKKIFTMFFTIILTVISAVGADGEKFAQQAQHKQPFDATKAFTLKQSHRSMSGLVSPFKIATTRLSIPHKRYVPRANDKVSDIPKLLANIIYTKGDVKGLSVIPSSYAQEFESITDVTYAYNYGGVIKDGVYYCTYIMAFMGGAYIVDIIGVDVSTGDVVYQKQPFDDMSVDFRLIPTSQTYDPITKDIYSICFTEDGVFPTLNTMEYSDDGVFSNDIAIYENDYRWCALACDANGQLWGIIKSETYSTTGMPEVTASYLVKIDKKSGDYEIVGETGQLPQLTSDATIDLASGRMFWTVFALDGSSKLCEVNLSTGKATVIHSYSNEEEYTGLVVAPAPAADKAPAVVTNLRTNFPKGSLSGTVDFTTPATLFDGTPASGMISYSIVLNGVETLGGNTAFGKEESVDLDVEAAGNYTIDVYVSNDVGNSPRTRVKTFIGNGIPSTPKSTLTYADGVMTVSWDAVVSSKDGGYIDPAEVTYTVTRLSPTQAVLAENIKECSISETIEDSSGYALYTYSVVAYFGELSSADGKTNSLAIGNVKPPYKNSFENTTDIDGFTTIDNNNDGISWEVVDGGARVSYNRDLPMDDWLITPAIYLETGKAYAFSFRTRSEDSQYPEAIEVKYGMENTILAMTETLLEYTVVENMEYKDYEYLIVPEETGSYFFGFHGCSDAYMYYLWIDDISLEEGVGTEAPGLAENLSVTTDPDGEIMATISFNAPTKAINGSALSSLLKVEVFCSGWAEPIKVFNNPKPGELLTLVDRPPYLGTYTYTVVAYNDFGMGQKTQITAFVGIDFPARPQNVVLTETENPGEVTLSWDPVTTDHNGNTISAKVVTYSIYEVEDGYAGALIADNLTTTTHTFQAISEGQAFAQYVVYAVTASGTGEGELSEMKPVGEEYSSMNESFADGLLTYAWGVDLTGFGEWAIYTKGDGVVEAQDDDAGFALMYGEYVGDYADLYSGKITLVDMVNPTLSFYRYVLDEDDINLMEVFVREIGGEYQSVYAKACNELSNTSGWQKSVVSLEAYKGKIIQIMFRATASFKHYSFLDNIKVGPMVDYDLALRSISAPASVKTGEEYEVDVIVANDGLEEVKSAKIELYADGVVVASKDIKSLVSDAKFLLTFALKMSNVADKPIEYCAKTVYDADQNLTNNQSEVVEVKPMLSKLPSVTTLVGELIEGTALLKWTAPETVSGETFEGFEDAESWAHGYDEWSFVDIDGVPVGSFGTIVFPGIVADQTAASFFVLDASNSQLDNSFAAHNGDKCLASMFNTNYGQIDDWAISPELSGKPQTISFYAKSYDASYPEKMEMYYSDGSRKTNDFIKVAEIAKVAGSWTQYSFDVPEGAKYFAVRSCASDNYMLLIDDFSYESVNANANLRGYNVYRDGEKLNDNVINITTYNDPTAANYKHVYQVTAVYDLGESKGSNKVQLGTDGIADVTTGVTIAPADGRILINGAEGMTVTICTIDGKTIFADKGHNIMEIPVQRGVYIVSVNTLISKLIVK